MEAVAAELLGTVKLGKAGEAKRHFAARETPRGDRSAVPVAFPVDTGQVLANLLRRYEADQQPIAVSFRDLVPWIRMGERATHHIHTYPAKLLPQIAHFFLATTSFVGSDETVLDPFAGTGTVALETILSGRPALYADANPLARLIATTKTRQVDNTLLIAAFEEVKAAYATSRARRRPDVVNLDRWFASATITKLVRLRAAIMSVKHLDARDLLLVTFSAALRKASLADPRFSVPVRRRQVDEPEIEPDVWRLFEQQFLANHQRLISRDRICPANTSALLCGSDARSLRHPDNGAALEDGSVGMILTSPPYAGAQKYVRAASLSLGWLGMAGVKQLRRLEDETIGREHFPRACHDEVTITGVLAADALLAKIRKINPSRALIAATYLNEMREALRESVRVLRPGGKLVLVIGDNTVCGHRFPTSSYLEAILHSLGMSTTLTLVDDIKSRGLMTRRATTAGVIATEQVIVFSKSG